MALVVFGLNTTPATVADAWYAILVKLLAAGWVPIDGSDGTGASYGPGLKITSAGVGAGGWSNAQGWQRLQAGDGAREIVIQLAAALGIVTGARVSYRYLGGAHPDLAPGTESTTPAADPAFGPTLVVIGAGTDAVPAMGSASMQAGGYRQAIGCASAAGAGDGAFYVFETPVGGGTSPEVGLSYEPVAFPAPSDPDPYVWHYHVPPPIPGPPAPHGFDGSVFSSDTDGFWAYMGALVGFRKISAGAIVCLAFGTGYRALFPADWALGSGVGSNPFTGLIDHSPVCLGKAGLGYKGVSTLYRWLGSDVGGGPPEVLTVNAVPNARIAIGGVSVEWDGISGYLI